MYWAVIRYKLIWTQQDWKLRRNYKPWRISSRPNFVSTLQMEATVKRVIAVILPTVRLISGNVTILYLLNWWWEWWISLTTITKLNYVDFGFKKANVNLTKIVLTLMENKSWENHTNLFPKISMPPSLRVRSVGIILERLQVLLQAKRWLRMQITWTTIRIKWIEWNKKKWKLSSTKETTTFVSKCFRRTVIYKLDTKIRPIPSSRTS